MRASILALALGALLTCPRAHADRPADLSKIHGRIQFVDAFPDYKVQVVEAFADLDVQVVESFPNKPGLWQIVEAFPDFKVQIVKAFPDFTIRYVDAFPGPRKKSGATQAPLR
jgi:hypothetical protein